jgi:predicted nucleic acid-binding protein
MDQIGKAARAQDWHTAHDRRVRSRVDDRRGRLAPCSAFLVQDMDGRAAARLGACRSALQAGPLKVLVIDASIALTAGGSPGGFEYFADALIAPPLLWSEVRSALHETMWRREISERQAMQTLTAFESSGVRVRNHRRLGATAWRIATEFGWAKTYDAEYVALAELLKCRLVTLDARLRRGAERLGFVMSPTEITAPRGRSATTLRSPRAPR